MHGDDRDRTGDLLLAKQALSQLSYVPSVIGESQSASWIACKLWAQVDSNH